MEEKKSNKKKKYNSPNLIKYGDFKKITMGTRQRRDDAMSAAANNKTRSSTG